MIEANLEKDSVSPPNPYLWLKLVYLIQSMWENGSIPTELGWDVLVIIPKGNEDTQGIGLLEVVCNVVEAMIYTRIKTEVQYYNVLLGF